jgi:hypothetical protein
MFMLVVLAFIVVFIGAVVFAYFVFVHAPYCLTVCTFQLRSLAHHLDYICSQENEELAREDLRKGTNQSGKSGREDDDIYLSAKEARIAMTPERVPEYAVLCWVLDELQSWQKLRSFITRYDYNFVYNSIGPVVGLCVLAAVIGILFLVWNAFLLAQSFSDRDGANDYPIYLRTGEITVITSCLFMIIVSVIGAIQFLLTYNSILDMQDEHLRVVKQLAFHWRHEFERIIDDTNSKRMEHQIKRIDLIVEQMVAETEPPTLLGFNYRRGMLTALASYIAAGGSALFVGIFSNIFFEGTDG